jgi:hypothetical protein
MNDRVAAARVTALQDLRRHWDMDGRAVYLFRWDGQFIAIRADGSREMRAGTPGELRVMVADDYAGRLAEKSGS